MAYETLTDLTCEKSTAIGGTSKVKKNGKEVIVKNPTSVEGYYLGSRKIPNKKSKTGESWLHIFQTDQGNLGVYGKTNLDGQMLNAKLGLMTKVTFLKMVPTNNNPMYKYKVQQDPDNGIEVSGEADTTEAAQGQDFENDVPSEDEQSFEEEGTVGEDEPALDEVEAAPATPPNTATAQPANRQAAAQRLFGKNAAKSA